MVDSTGTIFTMVMDIVKNVNQISGNNRSNDNNDFDYYKVLYPSLIPKLTDVAENSLKSIKEVIQNVNLKEETSNSNVASIPEIADLSSMIRDINDNLLEQVDACLQKYNDLKKLDKIKNNLTTKKSSGINLLNQSSPVLSKIAVSNNDIPSGKTAQKTATFKAFHAENIVRPQITFSEPVDNSNTKFIPHFCRNLSKESLSKTEIVHPYRKEIESFSYDKNLFKRISQIEPSLTASKDVVFKMVSNTDSFNEMIKIINESKERIIAIDLEHHSYRSFQGFTCTIQISIKGYDFIIDAIALRDKIGPGLSSLFLNPQIIKIFHGSETDALWLQRDFGLYIIGLFDTFFAAAFLEFPKKSFGYLLEKYWNVTADKKFQLADWRIRPLLPEMIDYAREDTRYLLPTFMKLLQELPEEGLNYVLQRSKAAALRLYEKPVYDPKKSWRDVYGKLLQNYINPNTEKRHCIIRFLIELCDWRDGIARTEDESPAFVMPTFLIPKIAASLSTAPQGIVNACGRNVPSMIKLHAADLALMARRILKDGEEKAISYFKALNPVNEEYEKNEQIQEEGKEEQLHKHEITPMQESELMETKSDSNIVKISQSSSNGGFKSIFGNAPVKTSIIQNFEIPKVKLQTECEIELEPGHNSDSNNEISIEEMSSDEEETMKRGEPKKKDISEVLCISSSSSTEEEEEDVKISDDDDDDEIVISGKPPVFYTDGSFKKRQSNEKNGKYTSFCLDIEPNHVESAKAPLTSFSIDPYAKIQIQESLSKKPQKPNIRPKSGNRSILFSNKK